MTEDKNATIRASQSAGHLNPASATLTGILDLFRKKERIPPLEDGERIDGKTCLVTGANSGLGHAVAIALAERGGRVLMACRSGIPEAGEAVMRASGSDQVEMLHVDLANLASIHALCDDLQKRDIVLDIVVLNAGLMPKRARRTTEGFEVMFGVHFLANRLLLERWLGDGVLRAAPPGEGTPRVILVSSESHRSAEPIDFAHFGQFKDYGIRDGMAQYGSSKLHMCTLAAELARRLGPGAQLAHSQQSSMRATLSERPGVSVHALCPGPVASNIAREAPAWLKPVLGPIMKGLFRSPKAAAEPVVYLASAHAMEGQTGVYLHMMQEKSMSPDAVDESNGQRLFDLSARLLETCDPSFGADAPPSPASPDSKPDIG